MVSEKAKDNPKETRYQNGIYEDYLNEKDKIWGYKKYMPPIGQLPKFYTTDGRCLTFERINKSDIQATLDTGESCLCDKVKVSRGEKPDELSITIRPKKRPDFEEEEEPIQMTIKRSEWNKYERGKSDVSDNPTMSVYMYRNDALPLSDKSRTFESVDGKDKFTISPTGGIEIELLQTNKYTGQKVHVTGKYTWDDAKISNIPNNDTQVEVEFLITRRNGQKSLAKMVMDKNELLKYQSEKGDAPSLDSFFEQEGIKIPEGQYFVAKDGNVVIPDFGGITRIILNPSKNAAEATNGEHTMLSIPAEYRDLVKVIHGPGENEITVVVPNPDDIEHQRIDPDNPGPMRGPIYLTFNKLEFNKYRDLSNAPNLSDFRQEHYIPFGKMFDSTVVSDLDGPVGDNIRALRLDELDNLEVRKLYFRDDDSHVYVKSSYYPLDKVKVDAKSGLAGNENVIICVPDQFGDVEQQFVISRNELLGEANKD